MKKLTIIIETDANVNRETLFGMGTATINSIIGDLEDYWGSATIQSSKIEVDNAE